MKQKEVKNRSPMYMRILKKAVDKSPGEVKHIVETIR